MEEEKLRRVGTFLIHPINQYHLQDTLLCISNICAEGEGKIQCVLDLDLLPSIVEQLRKGMCQKEAAWCVDNIILKGNKKQVIQLLESGAVRSLLALLDGHSEDQEISGCVLLGLRALFKRINKTSSIELYQALIDNIGWDSITKLEGYENVGLWYEIAEFKEAFLSVGN
jgi:hypothetical protein